MVTILRALVVIAFALNIAAHWALALRARKYLVYQGESRAGRWDSGMSYLKRENYREEAWPLVVRMQMLLAVHLILGPLAFYAIVSSLPG